MSGSAHLNMADVAREAGVSVATVSRALRGLPGVSEPTRERIQALARSMSYVVSPEASHLSRGSTGRVAIVVPTLDSWFFATMLAGAQAELQEAGADVLVYQVDGAAARDTFFDHLPARRKADAMIAMTLPLTEAQSARLADLGMGVVLTGARIHDYPRVLIDDVEVALQAVRHLVALGHSRIAMVRSTDPATETSFADADRTTGYHRALAEAGLEPRPDYLLTVPHTLAGGVEAAERLLSLHEPPTAVFAYSDELALAIVQTLRRAHLRVPEDVSVVGVDGHPLAELLDMTTVEQPVEQQGRLAGRLALRLLSDGDPPTQELRLPTRLRVRGTTGPPSAPEADPS
ncbi:LacI family DNA-binding transcriptional regulator [Nocardioides sp. CER19]|uniref:LacI family DNA-binding transcriptional regulator n=1 Tax=Nocardioides sp. CER19 TaxID=3038538 RepID=UPI00244B6610|nr:LacI family DNA-binding transcriptional regulator [Nocardioides sp. CER19]MDH2416234.1 LacI family DNA-binding transcriptional regulator [Nocardioides sp. CER19]